MSERDLARLAVDAIRIGVAHDSIHHSHYGEGDYEPNEDLKGLIQRARALGLSLDDAAPSGG